MSRTPPNDAHGKNATMKQTSNVVDEKQFSAFRMNQTITNVLLYPATRGKRRNPHPMMKKRRRTTAQM
jgi:hypothetical protein